MLTQYPKGLVAVVSDSCDAPTLTRTRTRTLTLTLTLTLTRYDIYNACNTLWGKELVDLIKNREGRLVVRPDSGDPPVIVCEVLLAWLGLALGLGLARCARPEMRRHTHAHAHAAARHRRAPPRPAAVHSWPPSMRHVPHAPRVRDPHECPHRPQRPP